MPTGVGTPKAAGLIASLVSSGAKKAAKAVVTAKAVESSKIHRSIEESVPPPVIEPLPVIVSQSPDDHSAMPPIDGSRFTVPLAANFQPTVGNVAATNIDGAFIASSGAAVPGRFTCWKSTPISIAHSSNRRSVPCQRPRRP